jgi:predicted nucleic acid-binding protein
MWIVIVVGGILLAIVGAFSNSSRQTKPKARQPKAPASYATILENGHYRDLSSQEVTALFAPYRERLKQHKAAVKKAEKAAAQYEETCRIDNKTISEIEAAFATAKLDDDLVMALWDSLFFEREESGEKYYAFYEDVALAADELEEALSHIRDTADLIRGGDLEPIESAKPKPKAKPPAKKK